MADGDLPCEREAENLHDPQAVAIKKVIMIDGNLQVVGHVPRKISSICSIFIRGGKITCRVTGHRRYLPQGGLELPCILTFTTASVKECSSLPFSFSYVEVLKSPYACFLQG